MHTKDNSKLINNGQILATQCHKTWFVNQTIKWSIQKVHKGTILGVIKVDADKDLVLSHESNNEKCQLSILMHFMCSMYQIKNLFYVHNIYILFLA